MIPRADRTLEKHHAVCEKHSEEVCEEVLLLREKPKLIAGALFIFVYDCIFN